MRAYSLYTSPATAPSRDGGAGADGGPDEAVVGGGGASRADVARAVRDLEAARQRVERDAQSAADELRGKLLADLIPLIDDLDRTIAAAERAGDAPAVLEGVRLVRGQFLATLERAGVVRIDARHRPFDPALHEAVSLVPVTHPSGNGVVIDQLAPGYRLGDRLLRPARVVVGRHTPRWR